MEAEATEVMPAIRDYIMRGTGQGRPLGEHVKLIEEGYLTSLQTVELVMFLEEQFGIEIDPEEVSEENFATLTSLTDLVMSKLG